MIKRSMYGNREREISRKQRQVKLVMDLDKAVIQVRIKVVQALSPLKIEAALLIRKAGFSTC